MISSSQESASLPLAMMSLADSKESKAQFLDLQPAQLPATSPLASQLAPGQLLRELLLELLLLPEEDLPEEDEPDEDEEDESEPLPEERLRLRFRFFF